MRAWLWLTVFMAGCGLISGLDNLEVTTTDGSTDSPGDEDQDAQDAPAQPGCPSEQGHYTMQFAAAGQGCPVGSPTTECIQQSGCTITVSPAGGGGDAGLSGTTVIASDGSFSNATITIAGAIRPGCTGVWTSALPAKLVITCGGANGAQSCIATLTHTADVCN